MPYCQTGWPRGLAQRVSEARLADQFDAVLHVDHTTALEPIDRTIEWEAGEEVPEAFPAGV